MTDEIFISIDPFYQKYRILVDGIFVSGTMLFAGALTAAFIWVTSDIDSDAPLIGNDNVIDQLNVSPDANRLPKFSVNIK